MEQSGEALGLNATINQDNGTETSGSNNIDVHMAKSTEWGTVAILASSIYGDIPPTTKNNALPIPNNKTGVEQMMQMPSEYVAGIYDTARESASKIKAAEAKYRNIYNESNAATGIRGDATIETVKWKNASATNLPFSSSYTFVRGFLGLFGSGSSSGYDTVPYSGNGSKNSYGGIGNVNSKISSRVAVVNGIGF
jgi:hypothetical protein